MDVSKILAELQAERDLIEQSLMSSRLPHKPPSQGGAPPTTSGIDAARTAIPRQGRRTPSKPVRSS